MITNDVSDYIHLLVRIAHIICNDAYIEHVSSRRWNWGKKSMADPDFRVC